MEKLTVLWLVKEFPVFYGNSEVHYFVQTSVLLDAILSQMNPLHTLKLFPSILFFSRNSYVGGCTNIHVLCKCAVVM